MRTVLLLVPEEGGRMAVRRARAESSRVTELRLRRKQRVFTLPGMDFCVYVTIDKRMLPLQRGRHPCALLVVFDAKCHWGKTVG